MLRTTAYLAVLFSSLLATFTVVHAEIRVDEGQTYCPKLCVRIDGAITTLDADQLDKMLFEVAHSRGTDIMVRLDSRGGDVGAAMRIGRQLRQYEGFAVVAEKSFCLSSCVLVLAGATQRVVNGQVGLHRPYDTSLAEQSREERQRAYAAMRTSVESYLREMNLPDDLFKAMDRVPSEKLRILSDDELAAFGLNQTDPVTEGSMNASSARKYGISMSEYLARKARAERECIHGDANRRVQCIVAIESGKR